MATSIVVYEGELRTSATHILSAASIITDAPPDNQGKGAAFSPTDLLATSLASCMLTIIGISARNHGYQVEGTKATVTKVMASNPRRVSEVHVDFEFPLNYDDRTRKIIETAAKTCPVAMSLSPEIKQMVTFRYPIRNSEGEK